MRGELIDHKYDLLRRRWQLINRRTSADPEVIPAAVWWIDQEVAEINKTLEVGASKVYLSQINMMKLV